MNLRLRRLGGALAVAALVFLPAPAAASVSSIDDDQGTPGYCMDGRGVSVVVDASALDGPVIVRCAPDGGGSGLETLKGAGFQIEGTQRFGEGFICRIENQPSATQRIALDGDDGYHESCLDTPPAAASWSYWHADNGGPWEYSQHGASTAAVTPGGFEGWAFSLNQPPGSPAAPGVSPERPSTDPSGNRGGGTDSDSSDDDSGGDDNPGGDRAKNLPPPRLRATAAPTSPTTPDAPVTGGEDQPDLDAASVSDSNPTAPIAAGAAVIVLGVLGAVTARRRRAQRSA